MNQHFDHAVCRLIASAAHTTPTTMAERLQEEWLADLRERGDPLSRLRFALGCWWAAVVIRHEGITGPVAAIATATAVVLPAGIRPGGRRHPLYSRNEPGEDVPTICEINTTPLIDVLLVLLITLILSLPMLTHAVKIDLPRAQPVTRVTPPEVIDLDIQSDGSIAWNGTVTDPTRLEGYFQTETRKDPQPEIHIRAAGRVKYDFVAKVLAAAQRSGMRKIGIVNTVRE